MTMRPMRLMTRRSSDWRRLALLCAGWLALCLGSAAAQQPGSAPTEDDLKSLLKSSTTTLRAYASPDDSLVGTLYFGLMRDKVPVGYEVYTTNIVAHGTRKVYSFDARALVRALDGSVVRVTSTGLAECSFSGLEAAFHLVVTGPHPANLTVKATRTGNFLRVSFADKKLAAPEVSTSSAGDRVVALSGELQRLIRLRKWKLGESLALTCLDAASGEVTPMLLRACENTETQNAGRPVGPLKVETWAAQQTGGLRLENTSFFDPGGSLTAITKPDGLVKLVLTKPDFDKDWSQKFPWQD